MWAVVLLALGGGGVGLYRAFLAPEPVKMSFTTAAVTVGDVASWVTATGTLSPRVTVEVGSQISGRITELFADFNSPVKKGELVARIDPLLFESEVASARASVATAEANIQGTKAQLENARLAHERALLLAQKKLVAQSEADEALSQLRLAEAQLAANEAQLAQARANLNLKLTNLAYTKIYSPIDGVVISRDVDVGQTVAASMQAPTLFTIAEDLRKMEIHTSVAESDVGVIARGMAVEFDVDAYPNAVFRGEVKEVRYSPTTEQNVVTYNAVVSVENPDLRLLPGMTAQVRFKVAEEKGALLVPNTALRFKPSEEFLAEARKLRGDDKKARGRTPPGPPPGAPPFGEMAEPPPFGLPPEGMGGMPPFGPPNAPGRKMSFVWLLDANEKPRPVPVHASISDGKHTAVTVAAPPPGFAPPNAPATPELKALALKSGDRVITSYAGGQGTSATKSRMGPPRRMGGFPGGPPPPPPGR